MSDWTRSLLVVLAVAAVMFGGALLLAELAR
jgi:hypothetical protein